MLTIKSSQHKKKKAFIKIDMIFCPPHTFSVLKTILKTDKKCIKLHSVTAYFLGNVALHFLIN